MKFITKYTLRYMSLLLVLVLCLGSASAGNSKKRAPQVVQQLTIERNPEMKNHPHVIALAEKVKNNDLAPNTKATLVVAVSLNGYSIVDWTYNALSGDTIKCVLALDRGSCVLGTEKGFLVIWNLNSNRLHKTFVGHKNAVTCMVRPTQETVVSASIDGSIKIWNKEECLKTFEHVGVGVTCMAVFSKGVFLSGFNNGDIKLWNEKDCIETFKENLQPIFCLQPIDKESFASGSSENEIKIWCVKNGQCIRRLRGYGSCLLCDKHGKLVSLSSVGKMVFWNIQTEHPIEKNNSFVGANAYVVHINKDIVASYSTDKTIKIGDMRGNEWIEKIDCGAVLTCLTLLDNLLVGCTVDGHIIKVELHLSDISPGLISPDLFLLLKNQEKVDMVIGFQDTPTNN